MLKKLACLLAALSLLCGGAMAESYIGVIAARTVDYVTLEADATLTRVTASPGDVVAAGDALAELATRRVYAADDGTVARVLAEAGDAVSGAVLEISPVQRYEIRCTVDSAYKSSAARKVRAGETVYIKCTADGSHRGTGIVTQISGAEYTVLTTGGELLTGEAVYLYRNADFTAKRRVGIGTVLAAATVSYEAEGTLVRLDVVEGEYVQRGELLYEYSAGEETALLAPAEGIVTEAAGQGATLKRGEQAFAIARLDSLCVEAQVSELTAGSVAPGDIARLIPAGAPEETPLMGRVVSVAGRAGEDGLYTVRIACDDLPPRLGMTVEVEL